MRTTLHLAAAAAAAALAATPALADDTFTCVPDKVSAGQQVAIKFPGHPGIFGGGAGGNSWVAYRARGVSGRLKIRSWGADGVEVVTPKSMAPGPVGVDVVAAGHHLPGPAGACFQIVVAGASIRGPAAPVAHQALTRVTTLDGPCYRDARITLTGTRFIPRSEEPPWGSGRHISFMPMASRWHIGATMVELADDDPAGDEFWTAYISGLRIRSSTMMELTVGECFVTAPGARARIWFPDGTKSAWVKLTRPAPSRGENTLRRSIQ
jgi:hypothetical protein